MLPTHLAVVLLYIQLHLNHTLRFTNLAHEYTHDTGLKMLYQFTSFAHRHCLSHLILFLTCVFMNTYIATPLSAFLTMLFNQFLTMLYQLGSTNELEFIINI